MRASLLILVFISTLCTCQHAPDELLTISGLTMGTSYSVKFISEDKNINKKEIHSDIEQILTDINQAMSTYIPDSELSLFNQSSTNDSQVLSDDLFLVIEHAIEVSTITNGAFDITVGPLVNLWGFGPKNNETNPSAQKIPTGSMLQSTMQHTGYKKLVIDKTQKQISKPDPAIYIDLSGIAKGFAVDKIAAYLDKKNIQNYLIEIGGELISKGINANQHSWKIGIEQAKSLERSVQRIVNLNNIAMATSGDYRNYFEKNGIRYSHTIDPVTGTPIYHNLASVTVLAKSTMHADALATAFMVLGADNTHTLANKLGIAVYTLSKTEMGFKERYNIHFKPYLSN